MSVSLMGSDGMFFEDAMGGAASYSDTSHGHSLTGPLISDSGTSGTLGNTAELLDKGTESAIPVPASNIPKKARQRQRPPSKPKAATTPAVPEDTDGDKATKGAKKKRARKPSKKATQKSPAVKEEDDPVIVDNGEDDALLAANPQRHRVLERNRVAATKCRIRKRSEASTLASCEQEMEDQNRYLSACFESLRYEIYTLKTQLLQHTDCDCVLIQKYIASEAKKSVDKLTGSGDGTASAGSGEATSTTTPTMYVRGSSCAADSINTQSPLTSAPGDGLHPSWVEGYPARFHGPVPEQMMEAYHQSPAMVQYNQMPAGSSSRFGPQPMDMSNAQYPQQQGYANTGNMAWEPGWQAQGFEGMGVGYLGWEKES